MWAGLRAVVGGEPIGGRGGLAGGRAESRGPGPRAAAALDLALALVEATCRPTRGWSAAAGS